MEDPVTTTMSLKEQKEAFVTGHEGTTPWEVLLVCFSAPIGLACYQQLAVKGSANNSAIALEALLVWFPMVLCQTKFLYPWGVILLVLQASLTVILRFSKAKHTTATLPSSNNAAKLDFLTSYRSSILYLTFIAILAVDFRVFPRRFAKTEVQGYGLMDVGAASFCLSAGLVSRLARKGHQATINRKQLLHTLPLIVIGLLRTWTNKELEYQEHVSEYGVHWNFFFTMGVLAIVPPLVPIGRGTWMLPAVMLSLYQIALSFGQLQEYIETTPRTCNHDDTTWCVGFVAANREGILGSIGYLSIYFIGEYVGHDFLWRNASLWNVTIGLCATFLGFAQFLPVSRRSTNAPFCLWAAAHNMVLLASFQSILLNGKIPVVFDTVNRHGLAMFLIANLLTGLVNLSIPTLQISDGPALLIVFGYVCLIGAAAMLLDLLIGKKKGGKEKAT
jgi:phosphatidylinositol glycan class W